MSKNRKMNGKSPMFSFVVPVYGTEAFLPRCIESILAQTSDDYELVIVNDGSPGNCDEIVARYGRRVRYFKHAKNRSLLQARLTGVAQARGEYIISVDSDDFVREGLVAALADEVRRAGRPEVIVYQMEICSAEGSSPAWHNHARAEMSGQKAIEEILASRAFWPACGKCFRVDLYRKAISELGIGVDFYLNSTEDLCQTLPILLLARKVSFIEYSGYYYWQNLASMTKKGCCASWALRSAEENSKSIRVIVEFAKRQGCADTFVTCIRNLAKPTIKWLLEEVDALSDTEWSGVLNGFFRSYGVSLMIETLVDIDPDFVLRWIPAGSAFLKKKGPVRKIAVLCQTYAHGGAERANWLWMKEMCALGKQVVWFYDEGYKAECERVEKPKGLVGIPLPTEDLAERARVLSESLVEHGVDTVVLVDHWRRLVVTDLLAAKGVECRVVVAEHCSFLFPLDCFEPSLYLMRSRFYPLADVVTALSPVNVDWFRNAGIGNVVYMPNLLTFSFDAGQARTRCKSAPAKMVELLWVGRLCTRKNPEAAIEALQILMETHPDRQFHLTLLGRYESDQVKVRVERCLASRRIGAFVSIPGEVSDVAPYYQKASVLLVTSRIEGAPMVITEAKSYGVPTAMFALPYVAGTEESDGVVSVAQGHTRDLAEAVYDLVSDSERYARFSRAAIRSIGNVREDVLSRWNAVFRFLETGDSSLFDAKDRQTSPARLLTLTLDGLSSVAAALAEEKTILNDRYWKCNGELWQARDQLNRTNVDLGALRDECSRSGGDLDSVRKELLWTKAVLLTTQGDVSRLLSSKRFALGCAFTWPFRMAAGVCVCLRENGLAYTLRRVPVKIHNIAIRIAGLFPAKTRNA